MYNVNTQFLGGDVSLIAYIGTKIVQAEPQTKDGDPGYRVVYPDGYVSWSPKGTFEGAYREVTVEEAQLVRGNASVTRQ